LTILTESCEIRIRIGEQEMAPNQIPPSAPRIARSKVKTGSSGRRKDFSMKKKTVRSVKRKTVSWRSLENDLSKFLLLKIDMIPKTSWGNNLHRQLPSPIWKSLREKTLASSGHKCSICGSPDKLHCDEVWAYDNRKKVQSLVRLQTLCSMCHYVKHIGHAGVLAKEDRLDYSKVVEHFLAVNNCNLLMFDEHEFRAQKLWKERSRYKWKIDFGGYL
jgi:hypothetical protein